MKQGKNKLNLAAPCGFYCGTCRHYLARSKGKLSEKKLKHGCRGCRIQNKKCSWVRRDCAKLRKNEIMFCFQCEVFPCDNLINLSNRHLKDDNISLIDELKRIEKIGAEKWLEEQKERWKCPFCGGEVCVMDRECYDCGKKVDGYSIPADQLSGLSKACIEHPTICDNPVQVQ